MHEQIGVCEPSRPLIWTSLRSSVLHLPLRRAALHRLDRTSASSARPVSPRCVFYTYVLLEILKASRINRQIGNQAHRSPSPVFHQERTFGYCKRARNNRAKRKIENVINYFTHCSSLIFSSFSSSFTIASEKRHCSWPHLQCRMIISIYGAGYESEKSENAKTEILTCRRETFHKIDVLGRFSNEVVETERLSCKYSQIMVK